MTGKRCPLWGQKIFPLKAPLELPNWEIPEQSNCRVLQIPVDAKYGGKRRKLPCTAQAIGRNKDKILEKLVKKLQPLPCEVTERP